MPRTDFDGGPGVLVGGATAPAVLAAHAHATRAAIWADHGAHRALN